MRPADVKGLCINYYKPNGANWYNSKYSWYCTEYAKNKNNEPRPLKGEDDNVNFYSINNFLAPYGIGSCHLRKIGADYASRVHGGKNDSVSDI